MILSAQIKNAELMSIDAVWIPIVLIGLFALMMPHAWKGTETVITMWIAKDHLCVASTTVKVDQLAWTAVLQGNFTTLN